MGLTERTIFEQFPYWRAAIVPVPPPKAADVTVFVGCGTSYNLALSLAAIANAAGRPAIGVPGGEWVDRPAELLVALADGACGRLVAQRRDHRDRRRREGQPRGRRLRHGHHRRKRQRPGRKLRSSARRRNPLGRRHRHDVLGEPDAAAGHRAPRSPGRALRDRHRARTSRQSRRQASLADRRPVALRLPRWRSSVWHRARGRSQADGDEPGVHPRRSTRSNIAMGRSASSTTARRP